MSSKVIKFDPRKLHKPHECRPWRGDKKEQQKASYTAGNANRKAQRYGSPGKLTTYGVTAMIEIAGGKCIYCGRAEHSNRPLAGVVGIDHVIPLSAGGVNNLSNVVPCCCSCNARKGTRDLRTALAALGVAESVFFARWNKLRSRLGMEPVAADDLPANVIPLGLITHDRDSVA